MSRKDSGRAEKRKDDVSVEEVYKEFIETFEEGKKPTGMAWIRGDIVNSDKAELNKTKERLYKPKSKLEELASTFKSTQEIQTKLTKSLDIPKKPLLSKKDAEKKRTSNLENLKEELKRSQEERAERRRLKEQIERLKTDDPERKTRFDSVKSEQIFLNTSNLRTSDDFVNLPGSYEADPSTTNVYIQNIDGKVTESILCELFGKFGPLASVKIMWPRTEEERSRGRNAAFVAFMNRSDAERAMAVLQNRVLQGVPLRLGWGKCVAIPPYPVYMPPKLAEIMQPQAPTGLPFNCSLSSVDETKQAAALKDPEPLQKALGKSVVRVVVPTERALLHIVHRMVEFVCREGPMFEAMIMNREINNPMFRFLFDNKNPVHIYYRWKLFSVLQGESPKKWRTEDFKMFVGGSTWKPPPMNPFTQSMPTSLLPNEEDLPPLLEGSDRSLSPPEHDRSPRRQESSRDFSLGSKQRQQFEDMLKELSAERRQIADTMVWCLDHAVSAEEVVDMIVESLSTVQTPLSKKIARLYLVSDLLHNSSAKVVHAISYRKLLQSKLIEIFGDLNVAYEACDSRMKKEQFKTRVMSCFRAWEGWSLFPNDFLIYLQNVFFGLVKVKEDSKPDDDDDIEGEPINLGDATVDLDGEPILNEQTAGLLNSLYGSSSLEKTQVENSDKTKRDTPEKYSKPVQSSAKPGFQRSKWEEVDPEQVEAQAVTTSRWDFFDDAQSSPSPKNIGSSSNNNDIDGEEITNDSDDIDGTPIEDSTSLVARMRAVAAARSQASQLHQTPRNDIENSNEDRRTMLREIEVKVMQYQDELESGQRPRESNTSIAQQVQRYREKLVAQISLMNRPSNGNCKPMSSSSDRNKPQRDNNRRSIGSSSRRRSRSNSRSPSRKSVRRERRSRSRSPSRKSHRKY